MDRPCDGMDRVMDLKNENDLRKEVNVMCRTRAVGGVGRGCAALAARLALTLLPIMSNNKLIGYDE